MGDLAGKRLEGKPVTVIVPLPPSYRGGTEEYAYRLARRLSSVLPVRVLTTTVRSQGGTPAVDIGEVPVGILPGRELFQRPLVTGAAAGHILRTHVESSCLVQLHMPFPLVEKHVTRWARAAKIPTVLTYHMDADFHGATGIPGAGLITRAYRSFSAHPALDRCDMVVSNSRGYAEVSQVLSRHLEKVKVVYKGVDPSRLGVARGDRSVPPRAEPGEELLPGSDPSERRVVFVGRLVPYKGIRVLLDAVRLTLAQVPNLKLYVAGTGPLSASLRSVVEQQGLTGSVRFLGFVPDEKIGTLYRSADVVACPSMGLMESTATTLEEAAACGTMTLGSSLPGTDETVPADGTHGLLAPPGDSRAVAAALSQLLSQPRPSERFRFRTWDDTTNDYLALFAELGVGPGSLPAK